LRAIFVVGRTGSFAMVADISASGARQTKRETNENARLGVRRSSSRNTRLGEDAQTELREDQGSILVVIGKADLLETQLLQDTGD